MLREYFFVLFAVKKGNDFALMACRFSNWAYLLKYQLKDISINVAILRLHCQTTRTDL